MSEKIQTEVTIKLKFSDLMKIHDKIESMSDRDEHWLNDNESNITLIQSKNNLRVCVNAVYESEISEEFNIT